MNVGSRYFVLLKDDSTSIGTVCFIRHEAEAFETFQEYETIAFRQTRDKIKALQKANGTEYTRDEFRDFLENGESFTKHQHHVFCSKMDRRSVKWVPRWRALDRC